MIYTGQGNDLSFKPDQVLARINFLKVQCIMMYFNISFPSKRKASFIVALLCRQRSIPYQQVSSVPPSGP
jgi:hypothetical protein